MRKLSGVLILALTFAACHSSSGPATSDPAVMPSAGSQYVYRVDRPATNAGAAIQLTETATIALHSYNIFNVSWTSDTDRGFFTTSSAENFEIMTDGDLWPQGVDSCCCDSTALPIASRRAFDSRSASIPTKKNGVEADGFVAWHTQFDGMENISAAGQTFSCSKVEKSVIVTASSGDPSQPIATTTITHIYWYSPVIQFFVKDQVVSGDSTAFTRTLMSYKLTK